MKKIFTFLFTLALASGIYMQPANAQSGKVQTIHNPNAIPTITKDEIQKNAQSYSPKDNTIVLNFEGLGDQTSIGNFYNGGAGTNYGIYFSDNTLSLIGSDHGGSGNFSNEPSPVTIMFFLTGTPVMNVPAGFTTGFSFYYASSGVGIVNVYDELDGTGNLLVSAPFVATPSPYNIWQSMGITFSGTAKSVTFTGVQNQCGFDDVTFGSVTPGGGAEPADHFTLSGPNEVSAGSASSNFTIQVYDKNDNETTVTSATTFILSTTSTGTTVYNPTSPVTIASGNGNTTFTYQDSKIGNYTITATRASGDDIGLIGKSATHNIEVNLDPWEICNTSPAANGQTEYFPNGSIAPVYGKFKLSATGLSTAQNDVHNFVYQPIGNTGTVIAHVSEIENGGWLGVEMRESCASNAKTVLFKTRYYNSNVIISYRTTTGKSMTNVSQTVQLTRWMKIQRNGSQFIVYTSVNGTTWTKRYTATVSMSTNILAGIFTESVRSDRTSIAQFDHVEVSSSLKSSEILDDETIATEQQVDIYPNPADELVNIVMPDNESKVKVTLTSMQGNVVLSTIFYGSEAQLNTSHINPGVYVLRFETNGNVITKRLVIM
jgi:hypothetical protein